MHRYQYCLWMIGYLAMILLGWIGDRSPSAIAATPVPNSKLITTYQSITSEFPNPERGFHDEIELISGSNFSDVRRKGYTIARAYIRLDQYRSRPLPATFLAQLDQQFQLVRAAGIKVIPRFSYNFPTGAGDMDQAPDASLKLTIEHINQLKPILSRNADVIAVLQAGFIGAWGEWHSSQQQLDRPEAKAKILAALLTALPTNRMVQVRYPNDIKNNYPQALTISTAFGGGRQARVGFKNDCFLANQSDAGTYYPDLPALQTYISKISPFVAVGGETCQATPAEHRSDCPTTEAELARFHWSYLNANFYAADLDRWKQEGCYAKIARNLGYRFQLVRSSFPSQVQRDRQLVGNFVIKNSGYASPFNPRGLEVIIRHRSTGKIYHLPILKSLSRTHDPRLWLPQVGAISVDVRAKIPPAALPGTYDLLLNLPDPMPKLANRPEYAIRLANEQTWEANTGFNSLRRTIQLVK
jgi:Domain of unknown function (DUF4832)/Domain of unknown function (DUF4874)